MNDDVFEAYCWFRIKKNRSKAECVIHVLCIFHDAILTTLLCYWSGRQNLKKSNQISIVKLRPSSYLLAIKKKSKRLFSQNQKSWGWSERLNQIESNIPPHSTQPLWEYFQVLFISPMQHDGFMGFLSAFLWLFPFLSSQKKSSFLIK